MAPLTVMGADFDIKGIELGMTLEEVSRALPGLGAHCGPEKRRNEMVACTYLGPAERRKDWNYKVIPALESFAGAPTQYASVMFRDKAVSVVSLKFRSSAYGAARDALLSKYGAPTSDDKDSATWRLGDRMLIARRHAGSLSVAGVTLTTGEELARTKKEETSRAAKDL